MKLEKAIELILNTKKEQADKSLKDFKKRFIVSSNGGKQTYFGSKRLILNKPGSVESYLNAGLLMKLNEEVFSDDEKMKFKELQIRHIDLFTFIELIQTHKIYDNVEELFQNIIDFCPEGKEIRRKKRIAYQFLQENKIQDTTSKSYFTRSPYTDNILKNIDIPEHQLVQILVDYQKYIGNTEWRNYIKEKEEVERKRNIKKTFVQWLQA
jgi:hypothetical protein